MKPIADEFEKLVKIVDYMFEKDFEECLVNGSDFLYESDMWRLDNDWTDLLGMEFFSGATKACMKLDMFEDWIIKFPFFAEEDYCETELKNYNLAVEAGIQEYFPETYFLSDLCGHTIILQERVECDDNSEDSVTAIWENEVRDYLYDIGDIDEYTDEDRVSGLVFDCVDGLTSAERVNYLFNDNRLASFCMKNCINDLHCGNFGYRGDKLVIIDFSGF